MTQTEKLYCDTYCPTKGTGIDCPFFTRNKPCERAECFAEGYEHAVEKACEFMKGLDKYIRLSDNGEVTIDTYLVEDDFKNYMNNE